MLGVPINSLDFGNLHAGRLFMCAAFKKVWVASFAKHRIGLASILDMRLVLVVPLLAQSCGAWVFPAPSVTPCSRPRQSGELQQKDAPLPFGYCGEVGGGLGRAGGRRLTAAVDGDLPTEESTAKDEDGGANIVKARLRKPVGLVLAEKEIGQPGLVVDDMTASGSAKECGIVQPGMTLVSAGGVDCGELVFDKVVELLQNSPAEEPIDFVFSTAELGLHDDFIAGPSA